MPYFKSPDGTIFFLDEGEDFEKWLPEGATAISVKEALESVAKVEEDLKLKVIRAERDRKIADVQWRYERHAREIRLNLPPTDSIEILDKYVQDLADITGQKGFPEKIKWPVNPFEVN